VSSHYVLGVERTLRDGDRTGFGLYWRIVYELWVLELGLYIKWNITLNGIPVRHEAISLSMV
jgi:hypothetical protein